LEESVGGDIGVVHCFI